MLRNGDGELLLCELHAHSTWSDGVFSVPALVDLYGAQGFDVLCVTDHVHGPEDPCADSGIPVARFTAYVAEDADEAYVLYRELDYFEQLGALESLGAIDLELIKALLGRSLIERWELWRPALHDAHAPGIYPMFEGLVEKLRGELDDPAVRSPRVPP